MYKRFQHTVHENLLSIFAWQCQRLVISSVRCKTPKMAFENRQYLFPDSNIWSMLLCGHEQLDALDRIQKMKMSNAIVYKTAPYQ